MRSLARFLGILFAIFSVGILGYYAYILGVETLTYPFLGSDTQKGSTLDMIVARPRFPFKILKGPILDVDALRESIQYIDPTGIVKSNPEKEFSLVVSGEHIELSSSGGLSTGESLIIDAQSYNTKKTTKYRLPHDMTLEFLDKQKFLTIERLGLPRDDTYHVSMDGFDTYTPENIRYFISYDPDISCTERSSLEGYSPIFPKEIVPMTREGQRMDMTIRFDIEDQQSHICLIGGVNGAYSLLDDRTLQPFLIQASTLETLSPEYDMQTRIEFRFSHPIYEDIGSLSSPEYIANRHDAKLGFLKRLSIAPDMPISPESLVLFPDRAILTLPLQEGISTKLTLRAIPDIYGRTAESEYSLTPERTSLLSLRLDQGRMYYHPGQPILGKLYALKPPKKSYTLKLCELSLETYSHIEKILSEEMTGSSLDAVYTGMGGSGALGCMKKGIDLTSTGYASSFDIRDFVPGKKLIPGLYMMTFMNRGDVQGFQKDVQPLIFSVLDSHISMKVDASGKMLFLVTESTTGKPLGDQEIIVRNNITRSYNESWNEKTNQTDRVDVPFSAPAFSTGIVLGKTNMDGFLEVGLDSLEGLYYAEDPYSLSFMKRGEYEGRNSSFLVESRSGGRLGYLVSTWNDGITGYDFGIKESQYSYEERPKYFTYFHTDHTHYLPGETLHIHAIVRESVPSLRVPENLSCSIIITDPFGKEISRIALKPNEFGTLSSDFLLPKTASPGKYSVALMTLDQTEYIANGSIDFQVETKMDQHPTASITLRSPDIEGENIVQLRKKNNTRADSPWYDSFYEGKFSLEGIIKGKYIDGTLIKNATFTYAVYRKKYQDSISTHVCTQECEDPSIRRNITEGSGTIDQDGIGVFRESIDYMSYFDDYEYDVEITLHEPLTGEEVITHGSIIVKLPDTYKTFSSDNSLQFIPKKRLLQNGELLQGVFQIEYGTWKPNLIRKYGYEIVHREYRDIPTEDPYSGIRHTNTVHDVVVSSGLILDPLFSQKLIAFSPGEYIFRTFPLSVSGTLLPEQVRREMTFYIAGSTTGNQGSTIRVIPEKTLYMPGETARVFVTVPFTGSHILLTLEKGGILQKQYFTLSGNTFTHEYKIDDTFLPNAYIGVLALAPDTLDSQKKYSVGYGEIVVDTTEKQGDLRITPDKTIYKNNETVSLDLLFSDRSGNPLQGEVALIVVDEGLRGILDEGTADISQNFYHVFPFTMKTSLTTIGGTVNSWFSRKYSPGISIIPPAVEDIQGRGPVIREISGRTIYYNPSVRTDSSGKSKVTFILPNTQTNYRILAIGNTKDSHFASAEKKITVRKEYILETLAPGILRSGDTSELKIRVSNTTKKITGATLTAFIGTPPNSIKKSLDITLNPDESLSRAFPLSSTDLSAGNIPYRIELREKNLLLEESTGSFQFIPISDLPRTHREVLIFSGTTFHYSLPQIGSGMERMSSKVSISIAPPSVTELMNILTSLTHTQYNSIEERIGSILSNLILLSFSDIPRLSPDIPGTREEIDGEFSHIVHLQHPSGGWITWENDMEPDIYRTPYILRSLLIFRSFGQVVPQAVIDTGARYLLNNLSLYREDEDILAETTWTLSLLDHPSEARELWKSIDTKKLHRHGYLAYANAGKYLGILPPETGKNLDIIMFSTGVTDTLRYSDELVDQGIYAQYLFENREEQKASALIDRIVRNTDFSSRAISTQAKVQILLALMKQRQLMGKSISKNLPMAFRSDTLIVDATLSPTNSNREIHTTRDAIGEGFTLKKDDAHFPVAITIITHDRTKDIRDMPVVDSQGMSIVRTFELIDESKGVDSDGKYRSVQPVIGGTFQKGLLYRVTLKSFIPSSGEQTPWYNLIIEDQFPGGWNPIIASSNSVNPLSPWLNHSWNRSEFHAEKMFASIDTGYGKSSTYTYYIRPSIIGNYLIPPATSMFLYHPEIHAMTHYEKVQVRD